MSSPPDSVSSLAPLARPQAQLRPGGAPSQPDSAPAGQGASQSADDAAAIRRDLRVRLLRDLVKNGLYRVPTEALAERLVGIVSDPA